MINDNNILNNNKSDLTNNDYVVDYDPKCYLQMHFVVQNTNPTTVPFDFFPLNVIKILQEHKDKFRGKRRLLEFGGGPALWASFLLAQYFNEIWFCDYSPLNLQVIQDWKDNKPTAFDWKPYFNFIIDKFRKDDCNNLTEYEIKLRQALVNGKLFRCDVNGDKSLFIDCDEPQGNFDMIYTNSCLEAACPTYDVLQRTIDRFVHLLNPDGMLLICTYRNASIFYFNNQKFHDLPINEEIIHKAFAKTGKLTEPICVTADEPPEMLGMFDGFMINYAFKI